MVAVVAAALIVSGARGVEQVVFQRWLWNKTCAGVRAPSQTSWATSGNWLLFPCFHSLYCEVGTIHPYSEVMWRHQLTQHT